MLNKFKLYYYYTRGGYIPYAPLILAAWDSTNAAKRERFIYHINYAAEKGALRSD